jgi:hypothetical protein
VGELGQATTILQPCACASAQVRGCRCPSALPSYPLLLIHAVLFGDNLPSRVLSRLAVVSCCAFPGMTFSWHVILTNELRLPALRRVTPYHEGTESGTDRSRWRAPPQSLMIRLLRVIGVHQIGFIQHDAARIIAGTRSDPDDAPFPDPCRGHGTVTRWSSLNLTAMLFPALRVVRSPRSRWPCIANLEHRGWGEAEACPGARQRSDTWARACAPTLSPMCMGEAKSATQRSDISLPSAKTLVRSPVRQHLAVQDIAKRRCRDPLGGIRGPGHDTGSACRGPSARLDWYVTGGAAT